jgi:glutamine amidotransferase
MPEIIIYHMIAIIDYGMGNLRSVEKGFLKVGADAKVTNKPEDVLRADGVVLPGVGAFRDCMGELNNLNLIHAVVDTIQKGKPYLGICLGLQVLFSESDEFGTCKGLNILKGKVVRFELKEKELKIPQMGWNQLNLKNKNPLFEGIPDKSYFYFVHSYYVSPEDSSVIATTTDYGIEFTSSVWKDNIFAVQFHPEKSQTLGLQVLRNFRNIVNGSKITR